MAAAYAAQAAAAAALAAFSADARARAEREDLLRFQLGELEAARPVPGEDADARRRARAAARAPRSSTRRPRAARRRCTRATAPSASGSRRCCAIWQPLAALDPALAPQVERLTDAAAAIEDVARDLGRYARGVRSDPARLAEIEERLFLLSRLCRKHGGTVADLAARRDALAAELAEVARYDDVVAARQAAADAANARAVAAAAALTASRKQAALSLEKKVSATLRELGFATARLPVVLFEARDLGPAGADRVRFLFAPNPGEEPRPLARIASGGELSRVMLAVKQALARTDQVLTYVFDEVDAGVGGGAAEVIGRKLKRIAADRQVIVITHLAQVAAFADAHVRVSKSVARGKTRVAIEPLSEADRPGEIARMLAGAAPSPQAAAHADEMLRAARDA